jgi:hypothetical protein
MSIFGNTLDGSKVQDIFTSQVYNVNTNHPLTPNSQEYNYYKKYVSIHSEDRDIIKHPISSDFEIELPEDYLNVASVRLVQWTFPSNYSVFSIINQNITMTFKINNPYNPGEFDVANIYYDRIFEALWSNGEENYVIAIEPGFYNPLQMATELTNKFNNAVTIKIREYFINNGWLDTLNQFDNDGGYNRFIIVYNNVGLKMWFGNSADGFTLTNEIALAENKLTNNFCFIGRRQVPDSSEWGLPSNLGLSRCNTNSLSSIEFKNNPINSSFSNYRDIVVPRFFYGDVFAGDNGYWLLPLDSSGCQVHWVEALYKLNLMGSSYLYMEIAGLNCIDETQPYNVSKFTLTTNKTNGIVNSAFAKMSIPSTPLSQWFDKDSVPYKLFFPPAERIRKLSIKIRYHNGQIADFGVFSYSFMLEFTLLIPQLARQTKSIVYPPPMGH